MAVSPKRCPNLSKDASISKNMTEADYMNLDSIELKRCSIVRKCDCYNFFSKDGISA